MDTCCSCGEPYIPQSSAWGDLCGGCIAAQLELALMGGLPAHERMPMRRASDIPESSEGNGFELPARQRAIGE